MAGYGAANASYGYYKPPQVSRVGTGNRSLAMAAGRPTAQDPFGLLTDTTSSAQVARQNATPATPAKTVIPASSGFGGAKGTFDIATGAQGQLVPPGQGVWPGLTSTAATSPVVPPAFDVNLTPEVQAIGSLADMTDEQARAAALKQKSDLALNYGDENLARILGGDTLALAAANNPSSTRAQLAHQRDQNQTANTEAYNKSNLLYSGARVTGEEEAARAYQDQLAQAAANVNGALGGIDSNLASTLSGSTGQRVQALLAAFQNHASDAGAGSSSGGGGDTPGGAGPGDVFNARTQLPQEPGGVDPAIALAIAAAAQKKPSLGAGTRSLAA